MRHGSLALRLRVLRAERALTIEQAAERASVTPETISDAERGRRHPYLPTLRKLAKAYEVPVEELLAEEPAQEPELAGHGPKGEAPQEPGRTRTYSEVAKELEEVREGFRAERESFEENISRWERWLRVGGFSDAHLDEFLRNAK